MSKVPAGERGTGLDGPVRPHQRRGGCISSKAGRHALAVSHQGISKWLVRRLSGDVVELSDVIVTVRSQVSWNTLF